MLRYAFSPDQMSGWFNNGKMWFAGALVNPAEVQIKQLVGLVSSQLDNRWREESKRHNVDKETKLEEIERIMTKHLKIICLEI